VAYKGKLIKNVNKFFIVTISIIVLLAVGFMGFRFYKRLDKQKSQNINPQNYTQNAPSGKFSPYADLKFTKDYFPGTTDKNGVFMGGTETVKLVPYLGKLYAGIGYWNDNDAKSDPNPGAQVLVKDSATAPWRVEKSFGSEYVRTDALTPVTFTTDKNGKKLKPSVTMLLAGVSDGVVPQAIVWGKEGPAGEWIKMVVREDDGKTKMEESYVRIIFDHVDKVTGVHAVFAGVTKSALYRGVYDPDVPGKILWDKTPELTGSKRMMASAELSGDQYVTMSTNGNPNDQDGGLFKRIDGKTPRWEFIYEWIADAVAGAGLRGLTPVVDHANNKNMVLIGALETGIIQKIDPAKNNAVTEEINLKNYFEQKWGSLGGNVALPAYNDMTPVRDFKTGESLHLIGIWINHPDKTKNGAWYLVRHQDGTYIDGYVYDINNPVPEGKSLRAVRTIIASPFPEEKDKVFYFGGFDAGGRPIDKHNAAWIYKGTLK